MRRTAFTAFDTSVNSSAGDLPGQTVTPRPDRAPDYLESGRCGAQYPPSASTRKGRSVSTSARGRPESTMLRWQVSPAVDLRQHGESVGLGPTMTQHVKRAVVRLDLGENLHAAAIEAASSPPPRYGPATGTPGCQHRAGPWPGGRQRQPEPAEATSQARGTLGAWMPGLSRHRPGLPRRCWGSTWLPCRADGEGDLADVDIPDGVAGQVVAAWTASPGSPNDFTKSHPEPLATTPSTASAATGWPSCSIPLTTSWTVPSPPAATR